MSNPLRIGFVGFGAVAQEHLRAYRDVPSVRVVSASDTDARSLENARRNFGLSCYPTLDGMLDRERLDIVCVLTPPATHEELVRRCAVARVHVLCEKPLSLSVESCERMIEVCRTNSVRLSYGASYRWLPALMTAQSMIENGDLGQVLLLRESALGQSVSAGRRTLGDAHYPKGGPGGSGMGLCDHGIHLIDAFPWLINSVTTAAWGRGNVSGEPQGPEFLYLEYASGAIGQLTYEDGTYTTTLPQEGIFAWSAGWSSDDNGSESLPGSWDPHPGCIHVYGTAGSLRIFYYANALFYRTSAGVRQVRLSGESMPANFARQLAAFVDAIRSDGPTPVPGEAGLNATRALLSAYPHFVTTVSTTLPAQLTPQRLVKL
jgi:UDP-N-acetyl-2-amino-2-deoxyglucuronate dehydrogenase